METESRCRAGACAARSSQEPGLEQARQDGVPALGDRVWPGGSPDGLGLTSVHRQSRTCRLPGSAAGSRTSSRPSSRPWRTCSPDCRFRGRLHEPTGRLVPARRRRDPRGRPPRAVGSGCGRSRLGSCCCDRRASGCSTAASWGLTAGATAVGSGRSFIRRSRCRSCDRHVSAQPPSFFVINTLLGLRDDFGRVVRALMATQAGLTVILHRSRRSRRSGMSRGATTSPRSSSTA